MSATLRATVTLKVWQITLVCNVVFALTLVIFMLFCPALYTGASKPRWMRHFASYEMLWGKLKDAATRYVLRPVDASKCVCGRDSALGPAGGAYSTPQTLQTL